MSDDPPPRITAALATLRAEYVPANSRYGTMALLHQANQGLLLAKAVEDELPALLARLTTLEIAFRRVTPTFLCEDEVEEIGALRSADTDIQCLVGYIRDQDIEIDRSHEREAAQGARLAAADAVIRAYRATQDSYRPPFDEEHIHRKHTLLEMALAAYNTVVGAADA